MKESCSRPYERRYYLDWLRVLGMLVVLLFHSARFFDLIGWDLKNKEVSSGVTIFILFVNYWIMPLFFMLAGAGALFALTARTKVEFVRERFNRLIVPYFFGLFILVPPQRFLSALQKGQYNGEMLSFLPEYIEK
ncbi:MAG TPA: acyltransferase family protein, partial [Negativicutes bacterium]|nr:acyltransferase family protein [Negativicutes bacterium]